MRNIFIFKSWFDYLEKTQPDVVISRLVVSTVLHISRLVVCGVYCPAQLHNFPGPEKSFLMSENVVFNKFLFLRETQKFRFLK